MSNGKFSLVLAVIIVKFIESSFGSDSGKTPCTVSICKMYEIFYANLGIRSGTFGNCQCDSVYSQGKRGYVYLYEFYVFNDKYFIEKLNCISTISIIIY